LSYPAARPREVPGLRGARIWIPTPAPASPGREAGGYGEPSKKKGKKKKKIQYLISIFEFHDGTFCLEMNE
jgi:hypothetical protein